MKTFSKITVKIGKNGKAKVWLDGEDITKLHRGITVRVANGRFHSIHWSNDANDKEYEIPCIFNAK
jgi:hypothetical protein